MKILLSILDIILLFGMIGDKIQHNRNNFTYAFIATVIGIIVLCVIGQAVDVMQCGFYRENQKECTEQCRYFETCTRNPYNKEKKAGSRNGRCEVDQDNNGCI